MKEIFDEYIDNSYDGPKQQLESKMECFEKNYRKFMPTDSEARVLDIGVGLGEMLTCYKKWGYRHYHGIDISPDTINFCKTLGLNCEQVDDTVEWLEIHAGMYDVITLFDVLEHIKKDKLKEFIKAIKKALKQGGAAIIQVPNMQSPDAHLHRYNDITHEVGFVEHSLRQLLIISDFRNMSFHGFENVYFNNNLLHNAKMLVILFLRKYYWKLTRLSRKISGNQNPEILNPVFYAVVIND